MILLQWLCVHSVSLNVLPFLPGLMLTENVKLLTEASPKRIQLLSLILTTSKSEPEWTSHVKLPLQRLFLQIIWSTATHLQFFLASLSLCAFDSWPFFNLLPALTEKEKLLMASREKDKGNEAFRAKGYEEAVAYYSRSEASYLIGPLHCA